MSEKKEKKVGRILGIAALCILFPLLALWQDLHSQILTEEGSLKRPAAGADAVETPLILQADGLPEDYVYDVSVDAVLYTEKEIHQLMEEAKSEIDVSFFREGENADHASRQVFPKDRYADGKVEVRWTFDDYTKISPEGVLVEEELEEEGSIIAVEAELTCQEVSEIYCFSVAAYPARLTDREKLLREIDKAIRKEGEKTGESYLKLPASAGNTKLQWQEKKEYLFGKVILFEILIFVIGYLYLREKKRQEEEDYRTRLRMDYPEILSKLSILLGSGMSFRMAWDTIADHYETKKKKMRPAYELIVRCNRLMKSGETEVTAYRMFGEWAGVESFHRLSRLLIRNLEKGNRDLCNLLRKEAENAFEERKLLAKKKGEEAGTRMLLPLLLMMGIVIAIVIVPAIISFY